MASSPRIEELQKKFDENPRRYFAPLANEYRKAGDIDQAIFICQEYLPQQPGHMSGHIVFGQALFEARRFDEAKTVFETALTLDPENLIALRHLGDIAREQGDPATARSWYVRVLDADPRNEEIAEVLATLGESATGTTSAADAAAQKFAPPADYAPAPSAAAPEPVIDVPLETEPTESPLADFAALVEEVKDEAATRAPEAPAAELTVPHASTDSEPLDLDTLDLDSGVPGTAATPPMDAAPPAVPALEGLESTRHEGAAGDRFAPLDGLDVLEGAFSVPDQGAAASAPPASAPPAPELSAAEPVAPAATNGGGSAAASPLPELDELDALFSEVTTPKAESPASATSAAPPASPSPSPEPAAPLALPELSMGRASGASKLPPLAPEPMRTPAWGMPDLEVPGWVRAAPPPPATPPTSAPAAPTPPTPATPVPAASTPAAAPPPAEPPPEPSAAAEHEEVAAAEPTSATPAAPFVTETMAELYVRQGHRDEAIAVYRQLLEERPNDESLRLRLEELEALNESMRAVVTSGESTEETTIRDFLAALAARRPSGAEAVAGGSDEPGGSAPPEWADELDEAPPVADGSPPDAPAGAAPLAGLPVIGDSWNPEAEADARAAAEYEAPEPARDRATDDGGTVGGSIDRLFSGTEIVDRDERAASKLADAFGPPAASAGRDEEAPQAMPGRPARPAATELSLDVVFREPTPATSRDATPAFSFDQFFSDNASDRGTTHSTPDQSSQAQGAAGAGTDDIEQFNAWLEGLKKS